MSETHAKFSPSKLPRLVRCPGSHVLTASILETPSSYAEEGTMLHKVTERALKLNQAELSQALIQEFSLDEAMVEAVNEVLEFVVVIQMTQDEKPTYVGIEDRVTLEQYYTLNTNDYSFFKDVHGTVDFCLYFQKAKILYIIDWKYGQGVEVFPDSEQLKAYALGAMARFNSEDIETVVTIIGQPRLYNGEHFKEQYFKPYELFDWLYSVLGPALEKAEKLYQQVYPKNSLALNQSQITQQIESGKIQLSPSIEACLWCRIKCTCAARRKAAVSVAEEVFKAHAKLPDQIDIAGVTSLLLKVTDLRKYLTDLELYVIRQIQQGIEVPHFKMVAGRSLRKWLNEDIMLIFAASLGYSKNDMCIKKVMSPVQAEKKFGTTIKKSDEFKRLITKPAGKPTLVRDFDKRKAIDYATASDKFAQYATK